MRKYLAAGCHFPTTSWGRVTFFQQLLTCDRLSENLVLMKDRQTTAPSPSSQRRQSTSGQYASATMSVAKSDSSVGVPTLHAGDHNAMDPSTPFRISTSSSFGKNRLELPARGEAIGPRIRGESIHHVVVDGDFETFKSRGGDDTPAKDGPVQHGADPVAGRRDSRTSVGTRFRPRPYWSLAAWTVRAIGSSLLKFFHPSFPDREEEQAFQIEVGNLIQIASRHSLILAGLVRTQGWCRVRGGVLPSLLDPDSWTTPKTVIHLPVVRLLRYTWCKPTLASSSGTSG